MPDTTDDFVDRLLAGELSRDEEQRLARAALDDPDLFDALTAAALAKTVLAAEGAEQTAAPAAVTRPIASTPRSVWKSTAFVAGLAAAAVLVLAVAFAWRAGHTTPSSTTTSADASASAPPATPGLLMARASEATTPVFRSDRAPDSRPPRSSATIVRSADGTADIDIGSLDGLTQGMKLPVAHGSQPIGEITLTAVFRDRARGRVDPAADVKAGARVEVDRVTYVRAVLAHVSSRVDAGDLAAAHALVSSAATSSRDPAVPGDLRRELLATLGAAEYRGGHRAEALRLLEETVGSFDAAPPAPSVERGDVLNQLGVIQIENHDFAAAEHTLQQAQSFATGPGAVYVANNRGALAALRGDRASAERHYRAASSLAASISDLESDRRTIERNLASLPAPR